MPESSDGLGKLLDKLEGAAEEESQLSFAAMLDAVGRRSFGPLLLLAGLIVLAPVVGDIPGVPTTIVPPRVTPCRPSRWWWRWACR